MGWLPIIAASGDRFGRQGDISSRWWSQRLLMSSCGGKTSRSSQNGWSKVKMCKLCATLAISCYLMTFWDSRIWSEVRHPTAVTSPAAGEKSGWTPRSCARAKAKTPGTSGPGSLDAAGEPVILGYQCQVPSGKHTKSYWKWPCKVDLPIKNGDLP